MAKKSTPIEKAARMLDLVPFITSHQGISTRDLASQFGITEDELLSDLNSLWMCGDNRFDLIDLQFDSGYVTIRNAETLNLIRSLSQQEIISILIGLDLIEKNLSADRSDIVAEIAALRLKLGESTSRILDATPAQDGQILAIIKKALSDQKKIHISYFSPTDDEITERDITPLHLSVSDGRDFVTAFCDSASAQRTFRVDRIQSAVPLDTPASLTVVPTSNQDLVKTALKISRNIRRSREMLGTFVTGDGAEVSVSSYNSEWLSRTVISAAGAIEVTESSEIRSRIADLAAQTLKEYR
ncbi:WYL domain-containing protein [Actinobacteria bacterium IMCC25003]|nr:WYL domain-containing protein [Actinobacteria bacterium IMCC25003]